VFESNVLPPMPSLLFMGGLTPPRRQWSVFGGVGSAVTMRRVAGMAPALPTHIPALVTC